LDASPNQQYSTTATAPAENWPDNMRRQMASKYLKWKYGIDFAPATMARYFSQRSDGPPAYIAGNRFPLYPKSGLDRWAHQRLGKLCRSTSEQQAA
jgi:hypothetical protein